MSHALYSWTTLSSFDITKNAVFDFISAIIFYICLDSKLLKMHHHFRLHSLPRLEREMRNNDQDLLKWYIMRKFKNVSYLLKSSP